MQINPTGQVTSEAQVQAMVSGSQLPTQIASDNQVQASQQAGTAQPTDQVSISAQAQALAKSEIGESSATEGVEPGAAQSAEGETNATSGVG